MRRPRAAVRDDISAIDVVIMIKGVCEAARQFQHLGEQVTARQLDLVLAAISTNGADRQLRGRPPTAEDFERAMTCLRDGRVVGSGTGRRCGRRCGHHARRLAPAPAAATHAGRCLGPEPGNVCARGGP